MNRESFKAGFIFGLADNGYTPDEFEDKMSKSAGILDFVGPLALAGVYTGIHGSRMMGRGLGTGLQKLTEPTEEDLDIAKKEELVGEYNRLIGEAKLRAAEQLRAQTAVAV